MAETDPPKPDPMISQSNSASTPTSSHDEPRRDEKEQARRAARSLRRGANATLLLLVRAAGARVDPGRAAVGGDASIRRDHVMAEPVQTADLAFGADEDVIVTEAGGNHAVVVEAGAEECLAVD